MGFNRTFMELKYTKHYSCSRNQSRFNRTFMELKSTICLALALQR